MARDVLDLFAPVLPITHAVMDRMPQLVERYPGLAARDLVHVATCLEATARLITAAPDPIARAARGSVRRCPRSTLDPTPVTGKGIARSAPLEIVPHKRQHRDLDTLTRGQAPPRSGARRRPGSPSGACSDVGSRPVHHVRRR